MKNKMTFKVKQKKPKMKSYALRTGSNVNIIRAKNKKDLDKKLKEGVVLWNYSWKWDSKNGI